MASPVAGVHGIWNFKYFRNAGRTSHAAAEAVGADWRGWLAHGLGRFDLAVPPPIRLPVAYYADCLDDGVAMGADDPELLDPLGKEIFVSCVEELRRASSGPLVPPPVPQAGRLARLLVRQPADWITEHYGRAARRMVVALARELAVYFGAEHTDRRERSRRRVVETIEAERPRILLAHSLGSVVAYEALCARPDLRVELLVTLGSPLGIPKIIFDLLEPTPVGRGVRPPGVGRWVNIADTGDPVAVPVGGLSALFDGVDADHPRETIHRIDVHMARHYLSCARLAEVVAPYLAV